MATRVWQGGARAREELRVLDIPSTAVDDVLTLSVNGVTLCRLVATAARTAEENVSDLAALWNASVHPYATGIVTTAATSVTLADGTIAVGPTATQLGLISVAGLQFVVVAELNESAQPASLSAAATGPNDWSNPENWSGGAVPVNGDDVFLRDSGVPITQGLDQSGVMLARLEVAQSFTGRVGLGSAVAVTSDGGSTAEAREYRQRYLRIGFDELEIGRLASNARAAGSRRLCIECTKTSGPVDIDVMRTAAAAFDIGKPAVRLLVANPAAQLTVREARAEVGVAIDAPDETSQLSLVSMTGSGVLRIGAGTTVGAAELLAGSMQLRSATVVSLVEVRGGALVTDGDLSITVLEVTGGEVLLAHFASSGNAIGTLRASGGVISSGGRAEARSIGVLDLNSGANVSLDGSRWTANSVALPDDAPFSLQAGGA